MITPAHDLIRATIVADSINEQRDRITSMIVEFPRFVLSEFNTHRILSKNSASSRAIKLERMIKMVEDNPFVPNRWMKEHTGMQGKELITDNKIIEECKKEWLRGRDAAVTTAKNLHRNKVTKQMCNRLLEPFMVHTVLVTATEWENFFVLRAHPDAEIYIQELAHKMLDAYNASNPKLLKPGEWHIPFGDNIQDPRVWNILYEQLGRDRFSDGTDNPVKQPEFANAYWNTKIKIATARCARTSYINFYGKDDYESDINLHDQLLVNEPIHASPAEHCAQSMNEYEYDNHERKYIADDKIVIEKGWSRNFKGWKMYRTMLKNETATDPRVNKK